MGLHFIVYYINYYSYSHVWLAYDNRTLETNARECVRTKHTIRHLIAYELHIFYAMIIHYHCQQFIRFVIREIFIRWKLMMCEHHNNNNQFNYHSCRYILYRTLDIQLPMQTNKKPTIST